jgi:hypothetical protein
MNRKECVYFIAFLLIILCDCTGKNNYVPTKSFEFNSIIEFEQNTHDYGVIPFQDSIGTTFTYTNKGDNPLVIRYVKSSCGCTIPEWTTNAIKSNETGEIKVTYDAKGVGFFVNTIYVFYNGKDSPKTLIFKGQVTYPKDKNQARGE